MSNEQELTIKNYYIHVKTDEKDQIELCSEHIPSSNEMYHYLQTLYLLSESDMPFSQYCINVQRSLFRSDQYPAIFDLKFKEGDTVVILNVINLSHPEWEGEQVDFTSLDVFKDNQPK